MCVNKIERYFVNENFVYCYDIHNSAYTVKIKACYFLNIFKKLLCLCENMHYILRIFLENRNRLHARNSVFFLWHCPQLFDILLSKKMFTIAVDTPLFIIPIDANFFFIVDERFKRIKGIKTYVPILTSCLCRYYDKIW